MDSCKKILQKFRLLMSVEKELVISIKTFWMFKLKFSSAFFGGHNKEAITETHFRKTLVIFDRRSEL